MRNKSFQGGNRTDGVEFSAYTVDHLSGRAHPERLFVSVLNPTDQAQDRGTHEQTVDLPASGVAGIVLQTKPGPQNLNSDSYWTDIQFH